MVVPKKLAYHEVVKKKRSKWDTTYDVVVTIRVRDGQWVGARVQRVSSEPADTGAMKLEAETPERPR